jgi:hypothetical protein
MVDVSERVRKKTATPRSKAVTPRMVEPEVAVVVDAGCELPPTLVAELGMTLLPRNARADRKAVQLDQHQTLHPSCWPQLPRALELQPLSLSELVESYGRLLNEGTSVLALFQPGRLDGSLYSALKARSILLAGQRSHITPPPRIAVVELSAVGGHFAFLVQVAARAAADGMALPQVLTLLDRMQTESRAFYLTGSAGPPRALSRVKGGLPLALPGQQQLWEFDTQQGLFVRQQAGRGLAQKLWQAAGPFAGGNPAVITSSNEQLLALVNQGRSAAGQSPLLAEPAGLGLRALLPQGCVELLMLPDKEHVARICHIIRRIDHQPMAYGQGILQRGGL